MPAPLPPTPGPQSLHIILASSSPRRRELLAEAGYQFEVVPPVDDVECGICSESGPAGLVAELAYRKASAVHTLLAADLRSIQRVDKPVPSVIVAADTVAECDGFILGKPGDEDEARAMLKQLSGREHRVLSGVCVWPVDAAKPAIRVAVTKLEMDQLSELQLEEYIASGGWEGKAGAFGYQDRLGWVRVIEGSESNVVGLPMEMLSEMLQEAAV